MYFPLGVALTAIGALSALVSFFLPWVEASYVARVLPLVKTAVGLFNQELKEITLQLAEYSSLTGLNLAFNVDLVGQNVRVFALLPSVVAILAMVALVVLLVAPIATRAVGLTLLFGAGAVLGLLVFNVSTVTRLGLGDNWLTSLAVSVLGFSPVVGFWGSVLGLLCIAIGGALFVFGQTTTDDATTPIF